MKCDTIINFHPHKFNFKEFEMQDLKIVSNDAKKHASFIMLTFLSQTQWKCTEMYTCLQKFEYASES